VGSIEKFTFFREGGGASQIAVESRAEVDTDTVLMCLPGSLICSFKTRLFGEFFYANVDGTILGSGEVNMQFGTGSAARMLRTQLVPRTLQSAGGSFAGISTVKMEFPARKAGRPDKSSATIEEAEKRWAGTPIWLKILIVTGGVAVVLVGCGAGCFCCLLLRQFLVGGKNEEDELRSARVFYKEEPFQSHREGLNHSIGRDPIQNGDNVKRLTDTDCSSSSEKDEENQQPPTRRFVKPPQFLLVPPPQAEESSGEETELPPEPTDMDVCFDAGEHPGTKAFNKALKSSLRKFSDNEYGPPAYRFIKKQLPDRRFFHCDDEDAPDVWREVTKKELIELVAAQFDAAKAAFKKPTKNKLPTQTKKKIPKQTKKKIPKEASVKKLAILGEVVAFWSKGLVERGNPSDEPVAVVQPVQDTASMNDLD
jgi:hypothetical protein